MCTEGPTGSRPGVVHALVLGAAVAALVLGGPLHGHLVELSGVAAFGGYTALAFAEPGDAARGLPAGSTVVVTVWNGGSAQRDLVVVAVSTGWSEERAISLAAGASGRVELTVPGEGDRLTVALAGTTIAIDAPIVAGR